MAFTFFTLLPNGDIRIREQNGATRVIGPDHPDYRRCYDQHFSANRSTQANTAGDKNIFDDIFGQAAGEPTEAVRQRQKRQRAALNWIKAAFACYLVAGLVYCIYSVATGTGLAGWIIDLQFKMFGEAEETITYILLGLVIGLPGLVAFIAAWHHARKGLWSQQTVEYFDPQQRQSSTSTRRPRSTGLTVGPGTRKWWLMGMLGPLAVSLAVVACSVIMERLKNHKIYRMDLATSAVLPAADARFIYISGVIQEDYEYVVTRQGSSTKAEEDEMKYYTPLTAPGWIRNQPVNYILYRQTFREFEHRIANGNQIEPNRGSFAGVFLVEVSRGRLPTYVKDAFDKAGIQVAEPCYIADLKGSGDDGSQTYAEAELPTVTMVIVLSLGALLSFYLGVVWIGVWLRTRRLAAKT